MTDEINARLSTSPFQTEVKCEDCTDEEEQNAEWLAEQLQSSLDGDMESILPEVSRAPLVFDGFYTPIPGLGPSATYELANQPRYSLSLSGVILTYFGARVQLREALDSSGECPQTQSGTTVSLAAYSGWASEVERHADESVSHRQALVKGYLTQHVVLTSAGPPRTCRCEGCEEPQTFCGNSSYAYRFVLHPAGGGRPIQFFRKPEETVTTSTRTFDLDGCPTSQTIPAPPSRFWSEDGTMLLDVSSAGKPVLHYPDGSFEELGPALFVHQPVGGPSGCLAVPAASYGCMGCQPTGPLLSTDRNGNRSVYTISANGLVETVTDPRGRTTTLTYEAHAPFKRLRFADVPAPGGGTHRYTVNWTIQTIPFGSVFPDIQCPIFGSCGSANVDLVASVQVPDGRSYSFQYGPWGNLTRVAEPSGAVRTYEYGDSSNTAYAVSSAPVSSRAPKAANGTLDGCAIWTGQAINLQKRGLVRERLFPDGQGAGRPEHLTTTAYEYRALAGCPLDALGASTNPTLCCAQVWQRTTLPDGAVRRVGTCANALPPASPFGTGPTTIHGWEIGEETWDPGTGSPAAACTLAGGCRSASYSIDKATGQHSFEFEPILAFSMPSAPVGDRRPRRVVSIRDGVASTTTFTYGDAIDIHPGSGTVLRNTGNVSRQCVWSGSAATSCDAGGGGTKQVETTTSYFHPSPYHDPDHDLTRHILRLPASTQLVDPVRGILTRTDHAYDQFTLQASGAPNRVEVGPARGNGTTLTAYTQPASGGGPLSITTRYFDTGDVREVRDARNKPTTTTPDFRLCTQTSRLQTTVANALGHPVTTTTDCNSGLALSVLDANNQLICSKYDSLGRLLETAGPGDSLTPGGITNSATCPVGASGPTTRHEHFRFGLEAAGIDQQRSVVRIKDGSADGRYVKSFFDGIGRTVQTRAEVDPATSGGFAEQVTSVEFDNAGRVIRNHVPCYAVASDTRAGCPSSRFTATAYDALGRKTSVTPPGLPASTTQYSGSGSAWLTTVTNPRGFQSRSTTDLLGRTVETSRFWQECPGGGCWLSTTMDYDAAGRLLRSRDANGNEITMAYDGLGRKLSMTDPDMGGFAGRSWSYGYDANGNLLFQTDAKNQTIAFQYDDLSRVLLKDLPPAGPGEEDVTFHYDGVLPGTCHSCDDRCATTTDTCNAATLTCSHTGTPCDGGPPPTCNFSLSPTSASFGSAGGSGSLSVTAGTGCGWTATSNASWITVTGGTPGSGNGTVSYTVQSNPGAARTGTLTVAGQTFTVTQSGASGGCSYSISPTSASIAKGGGAGSVSVTAGAGCGWAAASNAPWLTITSGASGTGSGSVTYSVAANSGPQRTGTVTVAGQTFTVTQSGASGGCSYSLSKTSAVAPVGLSTGLVGVNATAGCAWTATSNAPWLTITSGASGTGNGTVKYLVAANGTGAPRSATLTIAGLTFTLFQDGP